MEERKRKVESSQIVGMAVAGEDDRRVPVTRGPSRAPSRPRRVQARGGAWGCLKIWEKSWKIGKIILWRFVPSVCDLAFPNVSVSAPTSLVLRDNAVTGIDMLEEK